MGEVQGSLFPLGPGAQLLVPTTEFPFRLAYQPIARHFTFELSIWVDTMPLYNDSVNVQPATSSTAASSTITAATSSTSILAANAARKGATIWNNSTAILYLDLDAAASTTDYAARLQAGGYYEIPYGFTGAVSGIWSAVNGNALVREFS